MKSYKKKKNTYSRDLNTRLQELSKRYPIKIAPHQIATVHTTGQQFGFYDLGNTIKLTFITKR